LPSVEAMTEAVWMVPLIVRMQAELKAEAKAM
jgi:hypothetical protein